MPFQAGEKCRAISVWPNLRQPSARGAVCYFSDGGFNMQRTEARCNARGGHSGHVFSDGPEPGGLRHCLNSASLMKRSGAAEATNEPVGSSG